MNIFYIHQDPVISAKMQTNKHVVKMILESAQMLSTAHIVLDGDNAPDNLYKPTHINHPCNVWVRYSKQNYEWLYEHFLALCHEYTVRYGKIHSTESKLSSILRNAPVHIPDLGLTPHALCVPDEYRNYSDVLQSYRVAYLNTKIHNEDDKIRFLFYI